MLTVSTAWKNAVFRADASLRHLVVIDDTVTQWKIIDNLCDQISYDPALIRVDSILGEYDPDGHVTQIGRVSVAVQDAYLRPIVSANRMKGMKVSIALGAKSLAEGDFETYFTGFIDEVTPQPDGSVIVIDCLDTWSVIKEQEIVGAWGDMHPLEVILDILDNKLGLDSSLRDATSMDPSTAVNADNSHIVAHRASASNTDVDFEGGRAVTDKTSSKKLVNELLEIVNGVIVPDQDGKLAVRIFNPDASAVAHWDKDEIQNLEQGEDWGGMVNQVSVKRRGGIVYEQNDTDSQSNHAQGAKTSEVVSMDIENPWIQGSLGIVNQSITSSSDARTLHLSPGLGWSGLRNYSPEPSQPADARPLSIINSGGDETSWDNSPTTEGVFAGGTGHAASDVITMDDATTVRVDTVAAGVVTEFTILTDGNGTATVDLIMDESSTTGSGVGFSLTPGPDNLTEIRPLYWLLYNDATGAGEFVKATRQPFNSTQRRWFYKDPNTEAMVVVGTGADSVEAIITRAQFGTAAQAFPKYSIIIDVTPHVFLGNNILARKGGSSPKITVRTSLRQFEVEPGDLVTLDWPRYIGYGADGIDNTTKWEALSKEVDSYSNNPGIDWVLMRATVGTPTKSHNLWTDDLGSGQAKSTREIREAHVGRARVTSSGDGMGVTAGTLLQINIASGAIATMASEYRTPELLGIDLPASRDSYIYSDISLGGIVIADVANAADRPEERIGIVPLAKVVTDGTTITSITDLRVESVGSIGTADLALGNLQSSGECPNGSLGDW